MPRTSRTLNWRLFFIMTFFVLCAGGVLTRLFYLQILGHKTYLEAAVRQQGDEISLTERGTIYFQDRAGTLTAAAINKELFTLSVTKAEVKDLEAVAAKLSELLPLSREGILMKLKGNGSYIIIQRKLDEREMQKIREASIPGVHFSGDSRRVYPSGSLAANVLGYVSVDKDEERGVYGLERMLDKELRGDTGILDGADSSGTPLLSLGRRIISPPESGKDVVLTIDYNIERTAEMALDELMKKWTPAQGLISVVDPNTGNILAMASRPSFDPNTYGKAGSLANYPNPFVESTFELGSVMKPITMAMGINEGLITPSTTYTDPGAIRIGGYKIENFDRQSHGIQTMTNVLEKSLNTGAVFVEERLGHALFLKYIKLFGFGERSGVDLPGEVRGNISNLSSDRDIDYATASFGQGIAVTPIQMMMAASAVANGGVLVRPHVVERLIDDAGVEESYTPPAGSRIITAETAETVSKMLTSVTRNGFDNHAGVKGFFVAGKTGTAQIPNKGAAGYSADVIHSFIGYAPAFKPRFLIYIQLVRPQGVNFASTSLTPAFHEMASYILDYYGVPPDDVTR